MIHNMTSTFKDTHNLASKAVLSTITKPTTKLNVNWDHLDIGMAIRDIYDMSERTMIKFIMLGEFAKAIRERKENVVLPFIEIGMFEKNNTAEIKSLFLNTWKFTKTEYGYTYFFTPPIKWDRHIPVKIRVLKKVYKCLQHPDFGFYGVDEFLIPNPFDEYWKIRGILK